MDTITASVVVAESEMGEKKKRREEEKQSRRRSSAAGRGKAGKGYKKEKEFRNR